MGNNNENIKFRKPRRAKGTPFFKLRNYYALGVLSVSAVFGIAYEYWSETCKLKKSIQDGKFNYSSALRNQITEIQWGQRDPEMRAIFQKIKE